MLSRWDPFKEMVQMRRAMDRLIDGSLSDGQEWDQMEWSLALDVVEHENDFVVKASLPGVRPDDISVTFDQGVLTIKGQVQEESEKEEGQYHLRERRSGTFSRSISLPSGIQPDAIQADYADGILRLTLPKAEEVKPRRIAIKQGNKMIEGNTKK